jgi:polar amino acid transport system substrate-binding protein
MKNCKWTVMIAAIFFLMVQPAFGQTKKITLTTLDWEPYIGEKLPGRGYVYEIVSEAFKSVGYQVNIQFYPWARAVETARSGKADGLFPEYYDNSRKSDFVFSDPFPGGPVGFLARKDSKITFLSDPRKDLTKVLQGMKQYSFGVVRDYINTKEFDAANFLKKDVADSDEQNITKLYAKRINLIFIDKFVAQYLIKTKFPQYAKDLEFLEPALEVKPLYIVFSKKAPGYEQKVKDFNEGLQNLTKKGTIKAIMKKYGF